MKKLLLGFVVLLSSCGAVKYQYMPRYNKKIVSGVITEQFTTCKFNYEFIWFKIGDTTVHVWAKDLYTNMVVGKFYQFKGAKRLETRYDKR